MAEQGNMIAAGWNNFNLTNIENITVDSQKFTMTRDIGLWQEGQPYRDGVGIQRFTGYSAARWEHSYISMAQYNYIFNTILGNKYSGKVTIRTRKFWGGEYVIANAILTLPQRDEISISDNERVGKGYYAPFVWEFTRVEIIEEEMPHGIIYATGASTAQTGVTTTPEKLTAFAANGISDNMTADHTDDSITATYAGDYDITCYLSFVSTEQVYSAQATSNATPDEMHVSFGGMLALSASDIITVYVESDQGGGASITVSDAQLMAKRIALNV
jgi:hypothetical protein